MLPVKRRLCPAKLRQFLFRRIFPRQRRKPSCITHSDLLWVENVRRGLATVPVLPAMLHRTPVDWFRMAPIYIGANHNQMVLQSLLWLPRR